MCTCSILPRLSIYCLSFVSSNRHYWILLKFKTLFSSFWEDQWSVGVTHGILGYSISCVALRPLAQTMVPLPHCWKMEVSLPGEIPSLRVLKLGHMTCFFIVFVVFRGCSSDNTKMLRLAWCLFQIAKRCCQEDVDVMLHLSRCQLTNCIYQRISTGKCQSSRCGRRYDIEWIWNS